MPRLRRVGFTLPEMLLALVLFGIVGVALYRVLVTNQRLYQAQTQRVDLNQNLRTAVDMLGAELRPLNASEGDIVAMAPDSIKIRAMRQLGFICQIPVLGGAQPLTGIWMVLRGSAPGDTLFFGTRNFSATRDSLLVYYEGGTVTRTDDTWLRAKLTAVAPATCPNGSAGQKLTFNLPPLVAPQTNLAGNIIVGSPVWGFEYNVVYRSYQASDGKWYVGLRDSYGFQPVIGPLTGSGGLQFAYYDSTGSVTATPARVAMIRVRVAAQTAQPVFANTGTRRHQVDSVTTWIGLRNNLRRPLGT